MSSKNSSRFGQVWLIGVVVALGVVVASYFVLQSDSDSQDAADMQEALAQTDQSQVDSTERQNEIPEAGKLDAAGTIITTGASDFGTMLFDAGGQAIYIWELEESSVAECYGDCAVAWPPVLTNGEPQAMDGVNSELLGTTERSDGTTQVTYNDHPLYYYAHEAPGEVKCHNISTHGGLWWVIQPDGNRAG